MLVIVDDTVVPVSWAFIVVRVLRGSSGTWLRLVFHLVIADLALFLLILFLLNNLILQYPKDYTLQPTHQLKINGSFKNPMRLPTRTCQFQNLPKLSVKALLASK